MRLIVRKNSFVGAVFAFIALFSVILGVSAFFGIIASMLVSLVFQTESEYVFFFGWCPSIDYADFILDG